jgi:4-hydroxybenzoate polyprenyltransferase
VIPFALALVVAPWPGYSAAAAIVTYGAAVHLYACHINNLSDLADDRLNPARASDPLVTGDVDPHRVLVWIAAESVVLAALPLYGTDDNVLRAGFLGLLVINAYGNVFQKRSRFVSPLAMDYLFGFVNAAYLPLCVVALSEPVTIKVVCLASSYGFQLVLINAFAGNLKDLEADRGAGLRTTAILLGVRTEDGQLVITRPYAHFVVVPAVGVIGSMIVLAAAFPGVYTFAAVSLAVAGAFSVTVNLRQGDVAIRRPWSRRPSVHGRPWWIAANLGATLVGACAVVPPISILIVTIGIGSCLIAPSLVELSRRR